MPRYELTEELADERRRAVLVRRLPPHLREVGAVMELDELEEFVPFILSASWNPDEDD